MHLRRVVFATSLFNRPKVMHHPDRNPLFPSSHCILGLRTKYTQSDNNNLIVSRLSSPDSGSPNEKALHSQ
jgi:hypothetical protein